MDFVDRFAHRPSAERKYDNEMLYMHDPYIGPGLIASACRSPHAILTAPLRETAAHAAARQSPA
jgi:hypothetical protein